MALKIRSTSVSLKEISKEEMSFVVTAGRSIKSLKTSIAKIGLAAPPYLVFSEADGCYRIVCGFLRIKAVTELGWTEVPAMIFDSKSEEAELFLFSFFENLPHRTFNPVEKANIAERLLEYFS